ncbi:protein Hook protein [Trifolium repens]|nr:protein Hook protein [Trifolium repens]
MTTQVVVDEVWYLELQNLKLGETPLSLRKGLPIPTQTLDIKLHASKLSEQILRDQNLSLLNKLKEKDQLIEQSKYEAYVNALAIKKFVEENQKLAAECENLVKHCRKLEKECALYDNDREALIDFQNEAEERAKEACLRAEELERDLVDSSSAHPLGEESLLDSFLATLGSKDELSTYKFMVANSENQHCKKLLSMWSSLKQSTRRVLSLVAEVMSLEKDKEHLRINLDRAEEEGKLQFVENGVLEKENKRLLMKCKERHHPDSGEKLSHSTSTKSNKRKSSPKTSSPMAKKIDFDEKADFEYSWWKSGVLYPIVSPPSKFDHVEKGDALYDVKYDWKYCFEFHGSLDAKYDMLR